MASSSTLASAVPLQRKAVHDGKKACCDNHHHHPVCEQFSGSGDVDEKNINTNMVLRVTNGYNPHSLEDDDSSKKYSKPRYARHRRQDRRHQTLWLCLISVIFWMWTWRTISPSSSRHRRGDSSSQNQYVQDDRFHAKRLVPNHHYPRVGGLRQEPKQQHQQNQQSYQEGGQQRHQEQNEDKSSTVGGIFSSLFHGRQTSKTRTKLKELLNDLDQRIRNNENRGIRWINMQLIPPLKGGDGRSKRSILLNHGASIRNRKPSDKTGTKEFFKAKRRHSSQPMAWETHDLETMNQKQREDYVDYTKDELYGYTEKLVEPPATSGDYPKLMPLKELLEIWPQDELDHPPTPILEDLMHFDYNNPVDMEAAKKFREAKLPFKVQNVPEVMAAGQKWTDEYVSDHFDATFRFQGVPISDGTAQESPDNFFAWFQIAVWDVDTMGVPPTRNNDFTYAKFAQHARYADRIGLNANQPHYYWQSGVDKMERFKDERDWSFVSRDLPSFSSITENFFLFAPEMQKGVQCRFGERGVTAATHFDGGRNMVAMITGAKRYILSPPRECSKLGIVTAKDNPIYRHSLLNFGHLNHMDNQTMPQEERDWLELAGTAQAVSTVLKAGEVLYIPSYWFHYIISLQKSAQCNVRSGFDQERNAVFGGYEDVNDHCNPGEVPE